jgi:hypothetical protein
MGQRSRSSGSQSSHWTDRLIATGVGLGVGLGIAAGTIGVAKLLAPNNDSDAAAPKNGLLLRFNSGTVTKVRQDNEGNYGVIICTNPNTAATECGEKVFPASARDLMVEINGNKTSLADAAMAARAERGR